jgi:hypothetical protein
VHPPETTAADELRERLARLRETPAYRHYERVRGEVLRMKQAEAGDRPSSYWQEDLANVEYMFDASPLVIERLRHHAQHVTGVRPYEYRSGADERRALLAEKLAALREVGGDDLLCRSRRFWGVRVRDRRGAHQRRHAEVLKRR